MKPAASFGEFLWSELAPRPGRLKDALRITTLTVLVIVISETFRIPLTAYSAYVVFFASKEESASTILTGIVVAIGITLSVFSALGIYMISAGEPGLRLPLMAAVIFIGMFISRTSPIGPLGFIIGFLVTISLTLIDVIPAAAPKPAADLLTRSVLWLWLVVMLPAAVLIAGNLAAGRDPAGLFKSGVAERLRLARRVLSGPRPRDPARLREYAATGTSGLLGFVKAAGLFDKKARRSTTARRTLVARVARLLALAAEWPGLDPRESKAALLRERVSELEQRLGAPPERSSAAAQEPAHAFLAPDAFTNPDPRRFALKTTLAIFIAYVTYNLLDWPGIRTCMITCFFVALGSFGETAHKATLRMAGALLGGGLGLAAVLFLMPYLTTIVGLSLMVALVALLSAWVALSSERLSYAGLQIGLAFFLSTLVGIGPSVALEEARDRVVGVLLGNLIIFFVFSLVWPVSALVEAKASLAQALERLVRLAGAPDDADESYLGFDAALERARRFASLRPFEPSSAKAPGLTAVDARLVDAVRALAGPVLVLAAPGAEPESRRFLGARLSQLAERTATGKLGPSPSEIAAPAPELEWLRVFEARAREVEELL